MGDLELFLNAQSKSVRRKLEEQLKHSVSHYDWNAQHIPHEFENEDLLAVVLGRDRYMADTNSDWKAEASKPENRQRAFIIGRTVTEEQDNLLGIFFGKTVNLSNHNLFNFGIVELAGRKVLQIERIDQYFRSIFNENGLKQESEPRSLRTDKVFLFREARQRQLREQEKAAILQVLGIRSLPELTTSCELQRKRDRLIYYIHTNALHCVKNYHLAVDVARHCHALLLIDMRRMRTEFADAEYRNVFGDSILLQNALFLGANILSGDKPLKKMASYAQVTCVDKIP